MTSIKTQLCHVLRSFRIHTDIAYEDIQVTSDVMHRSKNGYPVILTSRDWDTENPKKASILSYVISHIVRTLAFRKSANWNQVVWCQDLQPWSPRNKESQDLDHFGWSGPTSSVRNLPELLSTIKIVNRKKKKKLIPALFIRSWQQARNHILSNQTTGNSQTSHYSKGHYLAQRECRWSATTRHAKSTSF